MTTKNTQTDKSAGAKAAEQVGEKKDAVASEVATDLAKDAVRQEARMSTGTESEVDTAASKYLGSDEIMQFEHILDLSPDAFEDAIDEKADNPLPENKIYGLLALERNGRNRTPYVKAAMKRLGLKKEELPGGGPDYTVDVTPTTKL